jgi:ABC-type transporter Mla subunit MlaD
LARQQEQAFASTVQHLAEHLRQFAPSQNVTRHLEQNLAGAAAAVNMATTQTRPGRVSTQERLAHEKCTVAEFLFNSRRTDRHLL